METLYVLQGTLKIGQKRLPKGTVLSAEDRGILGVSELARLKSQGWIGATAAPAARKSAQAGNKASGSAPWNLDPAQLDGKDLETLKVMIAERDPKFALDEVTEVEEAVALLSRDFAGTAGTAVAATQG
ncbi:MAG: hypothetical protein AAB295_04370 [Chloroflexota bacterium]